MKRYNVWKNSYTREYATVVERGIHTGELGLYSINHHRIEELGVNIITKERRDIIEKVLVEWQKAGYIYPEKEKNTLKEEELLFKIGDRVVCIQNYDGKGNGLHGVVFAAPFPHIVSIQFDKYIDGHEGRPFTSSGKVGHCWNFNGQLKEYLVPEISLSEPITTSATADTKNGKENHIMKITRVDYINNKDSKTFTMEEEITIIQQTEKKIAELEAIGTKTKKMTAEIERLKNSLNEALTLFDKEEEVK